jgi:hypothetical protein
MNNPSQQTRASSLESNHRHVLSKPETESKINAYRKNRCGISLITKNVPQYSSRSADRKRGKSPAEYSLNTESIKKSNSILSKSSNVSQIAMLNNEYNTISYGMTPGNDYEKNSKKVVKENDAQSINKIRHNLRIKRKISVF